MRMEDSLRLSAVPQDPSGALRVELVFCKPEDGSRFSVEMSVPNRFGRLSLFGVQAAVLRMAIADLQAEADALDRSLREGTASP